LGIILSKTNPEIGTPVRSWAVQFIGYCCPIEDISTDPCHIIFGELPVLKFSSSFSLPFSDEEGKHAKFLRRARALVSVG
jgi:hypothetical protein